MKPTILCPVGQRITPEHPHARFILRTAAALAHAGASAIVLAPAPLPRVEELLVDHGVPPTADLELVPISDSPHFLYRGRLVRRTRSIRATAIYTAELELAAALTPRPKAGAPLFYEAHALLAERTRRERRGAPFFDAREARIFADVDGLLTTVGTLADKVRVTYAETAPITVVPLAAAWAADVERDATPLDRPARSLGYIGHLYPLRGVDLLIEVLALLPEHTLTIVGGAPREHEWLRSEAVRFGVLDRVHITAQTRAADLVRALESIDVLLLPARPWERMPYVAHTKALEYLALARPIVAASLPSIREQLGEGTALLVAPEDRHAWANAIRHIDEDPAMRATLVANARARARAFTWEVRAKNLLAVMTSGSDPDLRRGA
ncbi:glycosyltransferase family 4 protein [Myxococcota bacterium]|nr:glycosyltransferase family 4 protein [Myxococcota bacterium]